MSRIPKLISNLLAVAFILPLLFVGLVATAEGAAPATGFGQAGVPVFNSFSPPSTNDAGEPGVGVNWNTGKISINNLAESWTGTVGGSDLAPTMSWVETTPPNSIINVDPLLFQDVETGRLFVGGLDGACSIMSFSDNDGVSWIPSTNACSLPGWDHQTVGGGPAADPVLPTMIYPEVDGDAPRVYYYCSQSGATPGGNGGFSFCTRSDDGGITWKTLPGHNINDCYGLHGHARVAPNGVVTVPHRRCVGPTASLGVGATTLRTGFLVSSDNGVTWAMRTIPGSQGSGRFDPSLAPSFSTDASAKYYSYIGQAEADGAYVGVTTDAGVTWNDVGTANGALPGTKWFKVSDLATPVTPDGQTIKRAEFAEVIAGDYNRAAFAFLGSTSSAANVPECNTASTHVWHYYMAMTYDAGVTWSVTRVTDDPVQRGNIGGPGTACRNMLDFNDITVAKDGRVILGFGDGCYNSCTTATSGVSYTGEGNSKPTVTRQSTGRGLFAAYDEDGSGSTLSVTAGGPYTTAVNSPVTLTALATGGTGSYSFTWNFDDGSPSQSGAIVSHTWNTPGDHIATVTVNDGETIKSDGATIHVSSSGGGPAITIDSPAPGASVPADIIPVTGIVDVAGAGSNTAPEATLSATPLGGAAPLTVSFTLGGTDADGHIAAYELDFGDGSAPQTGSTIPTSAQSHTYTAAGTFVATLTVTDDDAATDNASVTIQSGGLPPTNSDVTAGIFAYNEGGIGLSNVVATVTTAAGDPVPKYVAGETVTIRARGVTSADPSIVISTDNVVQRVVFNGTGAIVAAAVPSPAYDDSLTGDGSSVGYNGGSLVIPATWAGRYYIGFAINVNGNWQYISTTTGGHKAIDVIGAGVPGLPPTPPLPGEAGSDAGHSIGDADDDGVTPMGEIQWADVSTSATMVTTVMKIGQVPPQPAGDSPVVYAFFINGVEFESYIFGTHAVFDTTNAAVVSGAETTWDAIANTVTIKIPRDYLATIGADCPCYGHVEAQAGEGLAGGLETLDAAPNTGDVSLQASFERPNFPKVLGVQSSYGSASDPDNQDPAGDTRVAGVGVPAPWLDVRSIWISRENATAFDITLKVEDMSGQAPSVDAQGGIVKANQNYGAEFCVNNAAATYSNGASGVVCYRLAATNGALGVAHSGGVIQADSSGSCGVTGITTGAVFNLAASTVTWTVDRAKLDYATISASVQTCTATPPTRGAAALTNGHVLSRLIGTGGVAAGSLASVSFALDTMDATTARNYVFGGQTQDDLVALPGGPYSGLTNAAIAVTGSATGAPGAYTCAWSGVGAAFANANACSTTVTFATQGAKTITLTVNDGTRSAQANASVTVSDPAATEYVTIQVQGQPGTATVVVDTATAQTDEWSTSIDLSGLSGQQTIVATWHKNGNVVATTTRNVNVGSNDAFVQITSPDGSAPVSGASAITGVAGHNAATPTGLNSFGMPIQTGSRAGIRATEISGEILHPCAACQPMPAGAIPGPVYNQVVKGRAESNLGSSLAWSEGAGFVHDGVDGLWMDIAGFAGADYELSDEFDVKQDIVFFADDLDAQAANLGWKASETMPKTGVVPSGANWAFIYMRKGTQATADNQIVGTPVLKLTPTIVAPSAVQSLAAASGPGTVSLTWLPPANNGGELLGYNVYRDNVLLGSTNSLNYADSPGDILTHSYDVAAYNSAGEGAISTTSGAANVIPDSFAITAPLNGAIGVSPDTAISGTYTPQTTGNTGSGAFANTHYVYVMNLNSDCGNNLGYGDHLIGEKLMRHAIDVLGVPENNFHIYNEGGVALTRSIDSSNYDQLSVAWRSGALFDGPAHWLGGSGVKAEIGRIAAAAIQGATANPDAPARIYFMESSHGLQAPLVLGDGLTDSAFCLDDFDVTATELGNTLSAADPDHKIAWTINVDCSFCGGFVDAPLPFPETAFVTSAGVVGENRVVSVGCSWVDECWGNPAVTYNYVFNECAFTGDADGYGPMLVTGFDDPNGGSMDNEFFIPSATAHAADGAITYEEAFWCGLDKSQKDISLDRDDLLPQMLFNINDQINPDLFQLDGFVMWEVNSNLDLATRNASLPLDASVLSLPSTRLADPEGDARTPYSDITNIEATVAGTNVVVELTIADLTLSTLELEDVVEYRASVNGELYGACYSLGEAGLYGYDIPSSGVTGSGAYSAGTVTYDFAASTVTMTIPVDELTDESLPADVSGATAMGDCTNGAPVADDSTDMITTSEDDEEETNPGTDRIAVTLTKGATTINGVATLNSATATWTFQPPTALASGVWTADAAHSFDAGSGFVPVAGATDSVSFTVGSVGDSIPPTIPGTPTLSSSSTTSISISWTAATDNVGVTGYEVYRDGIQIATSATTAFSDSGLAPATEYTYRLRAFDAAGNMGPMGAPASFSTQTLSTGQGTVTVSLGAVVIGSADVDTSVELTDTWSIAVDWSNYADGSYQLKAAYDDGAVTVFDFVNVVIANGESIIITSPANDATVSTTFDVSGTAQGAGGPNAPASGSFVLPDGTIDPRNPGYALAQTDALKPLNDVLTGVPGFLGASPDLSGALVVRAYFMDAAPSIDLELVPSGWTLEVVENVEFEKAIEKIPHGVVVVSDDDSPPVPESSVGIGPGTHLLMAIGHAPGANVGTNAITNGCTSNFVWKGNDNKYYLGAAGHCFLAENTVAGTNVGGDYDLSRTTVWACYSGCDYGGQLGFIITGQLEKLGPVKYSRQTDSSGDVGNDFGIVEIPASLYNKVRLDVPVWDGPNKEGTLSIGEPVLIHGYSAGFGETWPTQSRAGIGGVFGDGDKYWSSILASAPGDSGSSLVNGIVDAEGVLVGDEAIGALTHLSGGGPVVGTTMKQAKAMVTQLPGFSMTVMTQNMAWPPVVVPTVPGIPTLNTLSPSTTSVNLAWTAPANDGGSAITGYTIRYGTTPSMTSTQNVGVVTSAAVSGLNPNTLYYFAVAAKNSVGTGANSSTLSTTTTSVTTVPGAPTALAAAGGNAQVGLSWTAPTNDGGAPITSYVVNYGTSAGNYPSSKVVTGTSTIVSGLVNDQAYFFVVRAVNSVGSGPASNEASATPTGGQLPTYSVELCAVTCESASFDGSNFFGTITNAPVGDLTVTAKLKDGSVVKATHSILVHVATSNLPPVVDAGADQVAPELTTVTLSGSASDDPADTLSYSWTRISGPAVTLQGSTSPTATFVAPDVSTDTVWVFRFTATDQHGAMSSDDVSITVTDVSSLTFDTVNGAAATNGMQVAGNPVRLAGTAHAANTVGGSNQVPTAFFSMNVVGATANVDAAGSFDADGSIVSYAWNFGDSTTGAGEQTSHAYTQSGTYTVTLTVTDNLGASAQMSLSTGTIIVSTGGSYVVDAGDSGYAIEGDDAILAAQLFGTTEPTTFSWTGPGISGATAGQTVSVDTTGLAGKVTYTVTSSNSLGTKTDTVDVFVAAVSSQSQTFENDVVVGLPDENAEESGLDGATFVHNLAILPGATTMTGTLTWENYVAFIPENPAVGAGGQGDFDLYVTGPNGEAPAPGAGIGMPETITVNSPAPGTWTWEVRAYVTANDHYELKVDYQGVAADPRPVASQVSGVCYTGSSQLLAGGSSIVGSTGAWDLNNDGVFETSGMTATTNYASGTHMARFRVTSPDGYTDTITTIFTVTTSCAGAPPVVVIAVADTGINLYAKDFQGVFVPYPELQAFTTTSETPSLRGPGDVVKRAANGTMLPFTRHPANYIPGFPANAQPLNITLGAYNKNADNAIWGGGHATVPLTTWFWVPGTKVVGAIDMSDTAPVNGAADTTPILDEDGHGTGSASVAAGNAYGSCPKCLLVFAESLGGDTAFFDEPWIDFVSVSGGALGNVGFPLISNEAQTKAAAERGQTIAYAAGNGYENAFLTPENTYTSNTLGPDWTIDVGAVQKSTNSAVLGTGKPVDWSSYGSGSIGAAGPSTYDTNGGHSGTSAATPISTGYMADVLLSARLALGDTKAGQKTLATAGQRQAVAVGTPTAGMHAYMADGVLQRAELWDATFHCASNFGNSIGYPGNGPATPIDYAYGGYGVADAAMASCAKNVLLNGAAVPAAADADNFYDVDEQIRDELWGDWDGDGDGVAGGNHNTVGTSAFVPHLDNLDITKQSVSTIDGVTQVLRNVADLMGVSTSGLSATETYYLHRDGCGSTGVDQQYASRTPAAAKELGNGCGNLGATNMDEAWDSNDATVASFATGSVVTANVKVFGFRPHPNVVLTATLSINGVPVGSAVSAPVTVVSLALVTTPCTEFAFSFPTTADIPAGATLSLHVTSEVGTQDLPVCYEGGSTASRFAVTGVPIGGGNGSGPVATIASPTGGEVGPGGNVAISGTATFPAESGDGQTLYLRRDNCANLNTDVMYLSPVDGTDAGNGCALTAGVGAPAQNFVERYPLVASQLPVTLAQDGTILGTTYFGTQGADAARLEFTMTSSEGVIGTTTKEVTFADVGGVNGAAEVAWAIPVPNGIAGKSLTNLSLEIKILQQGLVHWTSYDEPASFITIPRAGVATGTAVQVAIDDPNFGAASLLAVTGTTSWSASWPLDGVPAGAHTIYARAVTSTTNGAADSVAVTVVAPTTGSAGRVQVQITQGVAPSPDAWTNAPFTNGAWSYDWNTLALTNGVYTANVRLVTDEGSELLQTALDLNVVNARTPVLNEIGDATTEETDTLSLNAIATDADGDAIAYSLTSGPAGATVTSGGAFSWTTGYDAAGYHQVTIRATDTAGLFDEETFSITVLNKDRAPTLASVGDQTVAEAALLSLQLSATDPDADDTLQYTLSGLPAGATVNRDTGAFSWTPSYHDAGTYTATFRVTGASLYDEKSATITVTNVNRPPVLGPAADIVRGENELIDVTFTATDEDAGDVVSLGLTPLPDGATFTDGRLEWRPTFQQAGSFPLTLSANDGHTTVTDELVITVNNVNRAPVITGVPSSITINIGDSTNFTATVTDADAEDDVTVTFENMPAGATLVGSTFSWRARGDQAGVYVVYVNATDGEAQQGRAVTITVNSLPQVAINMRTGFPYATIALALADSVTGDTILLTPGSFVAAHVNRNGITICAADGNACASSNNGDVTILGEMKVTGDDVSLVGLTFKAVGNGAAMAINADGAPGLRVTNAVFGATTLQTVGVYGSAGAIIEGSTFAGAREGIYEMASSPNMIVRDNVFASCSYCIRLEWGADGGLVEGNTINVGTGSTSTNAVGLSMYGSGMISRGNTYVGNPTGTNVGILMNGVTGAQSIGDSFVGLTTGIRIMDTPTSVDPANQRPDSTKVVIRGAQFDTAVIPLDVSATAATVDARVSDWGVYTPEALALRVKQPTSAQVKVLQVPFLLADGSQEPPAAGNAGGASHTDSNAAECNSLDSNGDGFADAYHDGVKCNYLTLGAAILAAHAGQTIVVPASTTTPPVARPESVTIQTNSDGEALDGLTLCGSLVALECVTDIAPARWETTGTWATSPTGGQAIKIVGTGSTSIFLGETLKVSDLTELSYDVYLESGVCAAGSPRLKIRLDTNNDGVEDAANFVWAYLKSDSLCKLGRWNHIDLTNNAMSTWDASRVGGIATGTFAQAAAAAGNARVVAINFQYDNGGTNTIWLDNQHVATHVLREQADTACVMPGGEDYCVSHSVDGLAIINNAASTPTVDVRANNVTVTGLTIRGGAPTGAATGVRVASNALVVDNTIEGNAFTDSGAGRFGVLVTSGSDSFAIENNRITLWGDKGVYVGGSAGANGVIRDNQINDNARHAILIEGDRPVGLIEVTGNDLRENLLGNVHLDTNRPIVMRENLLGFANNTLSTSGRLPVDVDARANNWGVVGRDVIGLTFGGINPNSIQYMPYVDEVGEYHPPLVVAGCQERADGSTGSVGNSRAEYLGIQDAVDGHACPTYLASLRLDLAADALEAYDGATIDRSTALYADLGVKILAPSYAKPGLSIVSGSGRTFVTGVTFVTSAGATGVVTTDLAPTDFAYLYENTFVGGIGVAATGGEGPGIQWNRFVGAEAAAVFDGTIGGSFWSNEVAGNVESGAYALPAVQLTGGAQDTIVRANHIVRDQAGLQNGVGIEAWPAVRPDITGNIIRGNNAAGSIGIVLRDVTDATVDSNLVKGENIGLYARTSTGTGIADNRIVGGTTGVSLFLGSDAELARNAIVGAQTGLLVTGVPNVNVEGLTVAGALTATRLAADGFTSSQPTNFKMGNSTLSGAAVGLELTSTTRLLNVVAECNDWGAYSVATIQSKMRDSGFFNTIDFQPYTSADSSGVGCLKMTVPSFTANPNPAGVNKPIQFTDTSTQGSRPTITRTWTFGDGSTSTAQNPTHVYQTGGAYLVKLTLTDLDGNVVSTIVQVDVGNQAPVFDLISAISAVEGDAIAFTLNAVDPDNQTVTYAASGMPDGATLDDETGDFAWTPSFTQAGDYTVTFTATDGELTSTLIVDIGVANLNRAPAIAPIGPKSTAAESLIAFSVTATDADGDAVTITVLDLPAGATFDGAEFSWTPTTSQIGSHEVTFTATDGTDASQEIVTITVSSINHAPTIETITDKIGTENALLTFTVTGADEDGSTLTYSATNMPSGATLHPTTGVFSWTPTYSQAGTYAVTFTATDGQLSASTTANIIIANVDRAPTIGTVANATVVELATLNVAIPMADADGDAVVLSLGAEAPAWASVSASSLVLAPGLGTKGAYAISVIATANGLTAERVVNVTVLQKTSFTLVVNGANVANMAPNSDATLTATIKNTGPQTDTFAFVARSSVAAWTVTTPDSVTLAPGEQTNVTLVVHSPASATQTTVTLTATSVGNPTVGKVVTWTAKLPVVVTVTFDKATYDVLEPITGRVHVAYLDGSPAVHARVTVKQTPPVLTTFPTQVADFSDDNGDFAFVFDTTDVQAHVPGNHPVTVTVIGTQTVIQNEAYGVTVG